MKKKFTVTREHFGDKEYKEGDTRVADPLKVAHLIGTCLKEQGKKAAKGGKNKSAQPVANKADK